MEIRGLDNIVSRLAGKASEASALPSRETADAAKARKACREFESILLYRMLSTMRKAFQDEDGDDSGFGGDIFKSMMDEQLSLALAKSGGIGLASMLEKALGLHRAHARYDDVSGLDPRERLFDGDEPAPVDVFEAHAPPRLGTFQNGGRTV